MTDSKKKVVAGVGGGILVLALLGAYGAAQEDEGVRKPSPWAELMRDEGEEVPRCGNARSSPRKSRRIAQAKSLRMQASPDGCSRIGLPEGWRITGTQQGAVSAEGPDGAVDLGCFAVVWDSRYPSGIIQPPLSAAYSTPGQALQELMPQISRVSEQMCGRGQRFVRLIGEHPFSWPMGQAATLDYEFDRSEGGRGERWHSLTNIYMSPNPDCTWTVVWSGVGAPETRIQEALPTLLAIFESWQVSQGVLAGRLDQARKSLAEAAEIYKAGIANTQRISERAADDWDDTIRGNTLLRDKDTGRVYEVPTDEVEAVRRRLDEEAGRFRYEVIQRRQMDE